MTLSMHDASNDGLFAVLVDELKLADPEMVTEILTYIYSERVYLQETLADYHRQFQSYHVFLTNQDQVGKWFDQ